MENMNITEAQYKKEILHDGSFGENISVSCTIDGVEIIVPLDPANRHYAEIMRQVEAGTLTIADAD
jgi:hypothetical protein